MNDIVKELNLNEDEIEILNSKVLNHKETDKELFLRRFNDLYKGKRLLAVQLNGFSHSVFMDDGVLTSMIETERVNCAPEQRGNGTNTSEAKSLFKGFANYQYQNNAIEYVYVNKEER